MATIRPPDDFMMRQAQAAADFYNRNRAGIELANDAYQRLRPFLDQLNQINEIYRQATQYVDIAARRQVLVDAIATLPRTAVVIDFPIPTVDEMTAAEAEILDLGIDEPERAEEIAEAAASVPDNADMLRVATALNELFTQLPEFATRHPRVVFVFAYCVGLKLSDHVIGALALALAVCALLPKPP